MSNIAGGFPERPDLNVRPEREGTGIAEEMKDIRKMRLQREAIVDPTKIKNLIKLEASPVYNASGRLIQSTGAL